MSPFARASFAVYFSPARMTSFLILGVTLCLLYYVLFCWIIISSFD